MCSFYGWVYIPLYMYHTFFIHSSVNGYPGCFHVLCCCSVAQSYLTVWDPMDCSIPGFPVLHYLLEFAQACVRWIDGAIQLSHPLLPPSLSVLNLSQPQHLFQWVGFLLRWPKYWSFSFSISPSNEYSGLISFRIDWLGLLAVQGTLKSLLPHHNSSVLILWHSAFFMVQLSHPYMTTWKIIALIIWLWWQSDVSAF